MRVIYVEAEQGHAVPAHAYEPRGPFGAPIRTEITNLTHDPDKFPVGATAQNGMKEISLFECQICEAILRESELDAHICEGDF